MDKKIIFGSGLSSHKDLKGLCQVCEVALEYGIKDYDTAPSYRTEALLSKALSACAKKLGLNRSDYSIQTKIDPIHMYNGKVEEYFENKLKEMQLEYIDALLIHWPLDKYLHDTWTSLVKLKEKGLTRRIGICNLRIRHLEKLASEGITPEIVQIERHPLNTFRNEAEWCVKNDVILQDYSPLCKMHPAIRDNSCIKAIAEKYGKNTGQIILRWHIDTGAIPVFTSKSTERIKQYSELFDFKLSQGDIEAIYDINCNHKLYLESLICPEF